MVHNTKLLYTQWQTWYIVEVRTSQIPESFLIVHGVVARQFVVVTRQFVESAMDCGDTI